MIYIYIYELIDMYIYNDMNDMNISKRKQNLTTKREVSLFGSERTKTRTINKAIRNGKARTRQL